MKKTMILCLVLPVLAACMRSPRKHYYQLHIEDTRRGEALHEAPVTMDKNILIDPVDVEDIYNDYRIVYRTSPYQLNYYSYHFWIKKPGKLIRDAIYDFLQQHRLFEDVFFSLAEGDPHFRMKTRVFILEEYDLRSLWYGHLKMEIEIQDFPTRKAIYFHRFDRRVKLPHKRVDRIPLAISNILKEELARVFKDFRAGLQ